MTRHLIILVSLLFLMACHKDSDEIITIIDQPDPPEVLITTRMVTQVDTTIPDLVPKEIYIAGQTLSLQGYPFAQLKSSGIDRDFELVEVRTTSNLEFYHVRPLVENDVNYGHVALPGLNVFSGSSNVREDFSIPDGARINVPAGSVLTPDSMVFEGNYLLHAGQIDSTIYGLPIPGYIGRTVQNENRLLLFDKCFYIAATTQDGQPLIFSGEASLVYPGSQGDKWRFEAEKAIWLANDADGIPDPDRMPLGKDLYYAFAPAAETSRTTGTLLIHGEPTPNYPVRLVYPQGEQITYTTNSGRWAAYLPAGTNCTASIILPFGTNQEFSFTTSESGASNAQISVASTEVINARLTGTARDCDFLPLSLNYTLIEGTFNNLILSDDPELAFNIPVHPQSVIHVSSIDPVSGEQGPNIEWKANDTIRIYSTLACEKAKEEYLSLSVSDEQKIYWKLTSQSDGDRVILANDMTDPDLDLQVFIEGMNEGTYADNMLNIVFEDMALGSRGYSLYCPTASSGCGFNSFTITHFAEEEGQWIRGVFEGKFWIKTFHPLTAGYRTVKGEFQVFREF